MADRFSSLNEHTGTVLRPHKWTGLSGKVTCHPSSQLSLGHNTLSIFCPHVPDEDADPIIGDQLPSIVWSQVQLLQPSLQ